jgi:N-acetylglutamate synthase
MNLRIEELSLAGWPALQTKAYDGWLLRFAEGHTKRSNSVNPLYPSTLPLGEKIDACEALYEAAGLPVVFKILAGDAEAAVDRALASRGYPKVDETSVRVLDLREWEGSAVEGVEVADAFGEDWIEGFCACSRCEGKRDIVRRILGNVAPARIVASARAAGRVAACGYGAAERGFVGLFDIVVREEERRRGLGEALVRAILGRAAAQGAATAYLQVVVGNSPAERLYDKLGFAELYRYWYRRKGG